MAFKKGDLSINIVIIAVIALLVLVVLSYIFVGKISQYRRGVDSCINAGQGASCKAQCSSSEQQLDKDCDNDGDGTYNEGAMIDGVCCLPI